MTNPQWSKEISTEMLKLAARFEQQGHVWIASSGSSANQNQSLKLIALSKEAFLISAKAVNVHLAATSSDVWIQSLPRFHVGGLSIEARAHLSQSIVIPGILEKWNPEHYHLQIRKHKCTLGALVPTQVFDLVQQQLKCPDGMRAIVVGGAALTDELYNQALDLGWPLLPSYGLTECCSQVATAKLENIERRDRSLYFLNHIQADTENGKLKIKSQSLLTGFAQIHDGIENWQDPKNQGWYETQDLCEIKGSQLQFFGRESDFVKILGEGVSLSKLQGVLESCLQDLAPKYISEFVVAAIPDARKGHRLILVHMPGISKDLVRDLCMAFNSKVASLEKLEDSTVVLEIPRTPLGKIARAKLSSIL
jgi:o-succinylbenzoate---CoA ligase